MSAVELQPIKSGLKGEITVPGDKSISHRAVIFSSLAEGTSTITNFLTGEDCLRTVEIFRSMGVEIKQERETLTISGKGITNLNEPLTPLNFGNSGTTARLMSGVLAGIPLFTTAFGDRSLSERPMDRVIHPLTKMGAEIVGRKNHSLLPLGFCGKRLKGYEHQMQVKSAQVKSALLLAGMLAEGKTIVKEIGVTRDHTEKIMPQFGIDVSVQDHVITIEGGQQPKAVDLRVPGDISSAAFFLVAAAITPDSYIKIKGVGLNPTRDGIVQALKKMGARISVEVKSDIAEEPYGDIQIKTSSLKAITLEGDLIANLIDEIPIIALAATQAEGTTIIKDASELRVKETDRIMAVVKNLSNLGADIEATDDGMIIHGPAQLTGGEVDSFGDHRIGMMGAIASFISADSVLINDKDCINISYPDFFEHFTSLQRNKTS